MNHINGVRRIIIFSKNSDELGKFYRDVFRFPLLYHFLKDKCYVFNAGNLEIEIRNDKDSASNQSIVFEVNDINSAYRYYKSKVVNISDLTEAGNESYFDLMDVQGNKYRFYKYDNSGRF